MNMSVYSYMANNKKKWRAVYRYTDFTGKRRQTQKRGFNTKREAEFWLENKKKAENGQLNMTFGSFYEIYERDKKARVKETTFETKSYVVRDKIQCVYLPALRDAERSLKSGRGSRLARLYLEKQQALGKCKVKNLEEAGICICSFFQS